jgi:hypothetical protein
MSLPDERFWILVPVLNSDDALVRCCEAFLRLVLLVTSETHESADGVGGRVRVGITAAATLRRALHPCPTSAEWNWSIALITVPRGVLAEETRHSQRPK